MRRPKRQNGMLPLRIRLLREDRETWMYRAACLGVRKRSVAGSADSRRTLAIFSLSGEGRRKARQLVKNGSADRRPFDEITVTGSHCRSWPQSLERRTNSQKPRFGGRLARRVPKRFWVLLWLIIGFCRCVSSERPHYPIRWHNVLRCPAVHRFLNNPNQSGAKSGAPAGCIGVQRSLKRKPACLAGCEKQAEKHAVVCY